MFEIKKAHITSVNDSSALLRKTGSLVLLPQPCVPAWKLDKQIACQDETSTSRVQSLTWDALDLAPKPRWAANQC